MNYLLKIVEGPMKGAEVALVEGLRVKVGSSDECDIVLADGSLPAVAFELDVKADSVSFIRGEEVSALVPFEIVDVGTSAVAIGPAEGAWEPLRRQVAEVKAKGEGEQRRESSAGEKEAKARGEGEQRRDSAAGEKEAKARGEGEQRSDSAARGATGSVDAAETPRRQDRPRHRGLVVFCFVVVLLLAAGVAAWHFWPKIVEKCPQAETARAVVAEKSHQAWNWACEETRKLAGKRKKPVVVAPKGPTLAELARQYNLTLTNLTSQLPNSSTSQLLLRGNFSRRTERLAVRALALAADPRVKLELTDDETLASAAEELLFVVTEGMVKAVAATNGVVTLAGYAPNAASLERTIRAMNADVPGLKDVLAGGVKIGGTPPPRPDAPKQVFVEVPKVGGGEVVSRRLVGKKSRILDFPIAGILTTPYRTVVMQDGTRIVEGAMLGDALVEKIEPDRLVLKRGKEKYEWKAWERDM